MTDDQRVGTMSVMPKTARWFSDGTRYTNALATTPLCCPSRASIFTARARDGCAHTREVTPGR